MGSGREPWSKILILHGKVLFPEVCRPILSPKKPGYRRQLRRRKEREWGLWRVLLKAVPSVHLCKTSLQIPKALGETAEVWPQGTNVPWLSQLSMRAHKQEAN